MVRCNEVSELMDQLMQVPIFGDYEKRQMLADDHRTTIDPNLIMNVRHKIVREPISSEKSPSLLTEAERLLSAEMREENRRKRERDLLQRELRKFEIELSKSRPKFRGPYTCSKKKVISSDDEDFWRSCMRVKDPVDLTLKNNAHVNEKKTKVVNETACVDEIKVTIKEKPILLSDEARLSILRIHFEAFIENVRRKRFQREITEKIKKCVTQRKLRKCFEDWRTFVQNKKKLQETRKKEQEIADERKIELFVNAIIQKQKELAKTARSPEKDSKSATSKKQVDDVKEKEKITYKRIVIESPAQNRLKAQKKVIEEQKMKLAEQNKIINELLMKRVEEEIQRSGEKTLHVARGMLEHCGKQTRRNLIQLMRQEGYRDKSLDDQPRVQKPPKFLMRMEARAEARKERVRRVEEERRKKFEEQKRKEEESRKEEEENRRRLQREAAREAKRIREEQEREMEKTRKLNELADRYYHRYLLRRYIMDPFRILIKERNDNEERAVDHYRRSLLKKMLMAWKKETDDQYNVKEELGLSVYNRNLLWYMFKNWREIAEEQRRKYQVARDLYDLKLQENCFQLWRINVMEWKAEELEKENYAREYRNRILRTRYFNIWKKYMRIAGAIKESEKRKDKWREIVQEIIPDFNPQQRGVAIDD